MRRALPLFILCALLAIPVAAAGKPGKGRPRSTNGSLAIEDGKGKVDLQATGAVIGKVKNGTVKIKIFKKKRPNGRRGPGSSTMVYNGKNIRIRIVNQKFRVQIDGTGINISAACNGTVSLKAAPKVKNPGKFSIDGGQEQPLPAVKTTYQLGKP